MNELDKILNERFAESEEEPLEGHFERFSVKLMKLERQGHSNPIILKIAASVFFIMLSSGILIYLKVQSVKQLSSLQNNEIREAGVYYTNLINNNISDIEQMSKEGIGSEKEVMEFKKELAEMDGQFQNLEQDYHSNPNDERVMNAVIEYYQAKLEIVNTIKSDLENAKQLKFKYHENPKS